MYTYLRVEYSTLNVENIREHLLSLRNTQSITVKEIRNWKPIIKQINILI